MKKILSLVLILMLALIPMAVADEFNPADYPVAICMDSMNHPVHRIVQLGFLKAAEALGYTDAKVIGTEGGDTSEAFAAAEAFALEGGKGLLLWAGDSGCYETLASVASQRRCGRHSAFPSSGGRRHLSGRTGVQHGVRSGALRQAGCRADG